MRFRAKISEPLNMKNIAVATSFIAKLSKSCALRLSPKHFCLMVCDELANPKQVTTWCNVQTNLIFNEYNVEGTGENNDIYLQIPPDMLASSLSRLKGQQVSVRHVKIKLTDKMTPCLTVEIELSTEYGLARTCVHDIPVKILPRHSWSEYQEPPLQDLGVALDIKSLKKLRSVLEKCKKLSQFASFGFKTDGNLSVASKSTSATITATFKNCALQQQASCVSQEGLRVDGRRLSQLLVAEMLSPSKSTLYFLENRLLTFKLMCEATISGVSGNESTSSATAFSDDAREGSSRSLSVLQKLKQAETKRLVNFIKKTKIIRSSLYELHDERRFEENHSEVEVANLKREFDRKLELAIKIIESMEQQKKEICESIKTDIAKAVADAIRNGVTQPPLKSVTRRESDTYAGGLGGGYSVTSFVAHILETTSDHKEWVVALLRGVFGEDAKSYRLFPRKSENKKFPLSFLDVAKNHYKQFLVRRGYSKTAFSNGIRKLGSMLSDKCVDLCGHRGRKRSSSDENGPSSEDNEK